MSTFNSSAHQIPTLSYTNDGGNYNNDGGWNSGGGRGDGRGDDGYFEDSEGDFRKAPFLMAAIAAFGISSIHRQISNEDGS